MRTWDLDTLMKGYEREGIDPKPYYCQQKSSKTAGSEPAGNECFLVQTQLLIFVLCLLCFFFFFVQGTTICVVSAPARTEAGDWEWSVTCVGSWDRITFVM